VFFCLLGLLLYRSSIVTVYSESTTDFRFFFCFAYEYIFVCVCARFYVMVMMVLLSMMIISSVCVIKHLRKTVLLTGLSESDYFMANGRVHRCVSVR